jgi:hypothetical protein
MKTLLFFRTMFALTALLPIQQTLAWGRVGHAVIGIAAVAALDPAPRAELLDILPATSAETLPGAIEEACFWPDTLRESAQWSWSAPQHYVNIPRSSDRCDRQRDCPDGLCVTAGILKYAAELGRPGLGRERRWQALAWLCHLVGDLHQPLHAGFLDDRGANQVDIEYRGENSNLHQFWDSMLINQRLQGADPGTIALRGAVETVASRDWNPADPAAWTEESHALAATRAYPPDSVIDDAFADASWTLVQQQWRKAAERLALILNSVLAADHGGPD